ncbi:hypothetical protein D1007_11572 [Hordeum vulgare]|nr:hypothetical protein D1007_11572 [Hordeum vulgare]
MANIAWVPVKCDDELAIMFAIYAQSKSTYIEINIIQRSRGELERITTRSQANSSQARCNQTRGRGRNSDGRGSGGSRANSVGRGHSDGRGSSGGRNAGNSQAHSLHEPSGVGPSSSRQANVAPVIEEEALDDVPTDDEDEILHPEFFEETDPDERDEDDDMAYYESSHEDRTGVQFNRDDPSLAEGTIFSHVIECKNALATFSIKTQSEFKIDKSEPESFNSKIRKWKGLHIVDLFDKIRQHLMEKFDLRESIVAPTYVGHIIVPKAMRMLLLKSKGLDMSTVNISTYQADVTAIGKEKRERSPRKNFKRPIARGVKWGSPNKKMKGDMVPIVSITSKAAIPATNTRSKMTKLK